MSVKRDPPGTDEPSISFESSDPGRPARSAASSGAPASAKPALTKTIGPRDSAPSNEEPSISLDGRDGTFAPRTVPNSTFHEEPSFTIDARDVSLVDPQAPPTPRLDAPPPKLDPDEPMLTGTGVAEPKKPLSSIFIPPGKDGTPGGKDSSITFERVSGLWSKFVAPDTPTTHTIQRRPPREVMRTLRTASKVVAPPRSVTNKSGGLPPDYEIIEKLGEGGMGVVYLARQTSIDRTIAIKMLKPEGAHDDEVRARFLSEAAVTGALDHPNIVPIHDLGSNEQGALFYSMKRVRGTPWCDVLPQRKLEENLETWMRMADAVAFAHSRGIIHRDIKPENVMLGDFGEVLVMDWGLAMSVVENGRAAYYDAGDSMAGTPAYMAPEMASGTVDQLSFTSDVYLLGAVLFEIVTGNPPHTGNNVMGCLFAAASNQIRRTDKKGELLDIALKAMETNPKERFQTVVDLQAAVKAFQSHSESILLSTKAQESLERAAGTNDYNDFAESLFGFREALTLWSGNEAAEAGVVKAAVAYARSAFDKGDLDLATSLLDAKVVDHQPLLVLIEEEVRARENRKLSYQRITQAATALIVAVFVVIVVSLFWINSARSAAIDAQKEAENEAQKAKLAQAESDRQKSEAEKQKAAAEEQKAEADKQRDAAEGAKRTAETERAAADLARQQAETAKNQADEARRQVSERAYLAQMGLADAKVRENGFGVARFLLAGTEPQYRGWEFGRLRYLCDLSQTTYAGHTQPLSGVATVGDGRIVTASEDGTARLWDASGKSLRVWNLGARGTAIAVSPDKRFMAVGLSRGYTAIYDLNDPADEPRYLAVRDNSRGPVTAVTFAVRRQPPRLYVGMSVEKDAVMFLLPVVIDPAATAAAPAVDDRATPVRTVAAQQRPAPAEDRTLPPALLYQGHNDAVACLRYHEPTQRLVTASRDGAVWVWPAWANSTPTTELQLDVKNATVAAVAWNALGDRVAAVGSDGLVYQWNVSAEAVEKAAAQKKAAEEADRRAAAAGSRRPTPADKAAEAKDEAQKEAEKKEGEIAPFEAHSMAILTVAYAPTGTDLITAGEDNTIRVWSATGERKATLRGHAGWVRSAVFDPNPSKTIVYSASQDGEARAWDVKNYRETAVLSGHTSDGVPCGAFDPTGASVVTGGADSMVRWWDAKTGEQREIFEEGHTYQTTSAAVDLAGRYAITTATNGDAAVWDLLTGCEIHRLGGHVGSHTCSAVHPRGDWVATGDEERNVRVWSRATGERIRVLDKLEAAAGAMAVSPDGKLLAIGLFNGKIRLYDTTTWRETRTLTGHSRQVNSLAFTADGAYLYSASNDTTSGCWRVSDGEERTPTLAHEQPVHVVAVSRDGKYVATGEFAGRVRLWDATTRKLIAEFWGDYNPEAAKAAAALEAARAPEAEIARVKGEIWQRTGHGSEVHALAFTPDGTRLASGSNNDGQIVVWDVSRFTQRGVRPTSFYENGVPTAFSDGEIARSSSFVDQRWPAAPTSIVFATFLPDGKSLLVASKYDVTVTDVTDRRPDRIPTIGISAHLRVIGVAFHPSGDYIVSAGLESVVKIWDVKTQKAVRKLYGEHHVRLTGLDVSRDGKYIATSGEDGLVVIWDFETARPIRRLGPEGRGVRAVRFSPDGARVATAGSDGVVRVHEWNADRPPVALAGHTSVVRDVAFSHDGASLVSGGQDNLAIVWNLADGSIARTLRGHSAFVTSVDCLADGRRVVTASEDGTARVWDFASGEEILVLKGEPRLTKTGARAVTAKVTCVRFSPEADAASVLTTADDGDAFVWPTRSWKSAEMPDLHAPTVDATRAPAATAAPTPAASNAAPSPPTSAADASRS